MCELSRIELSEKKLAGKPVIADGKVLKEQDIFGLSSQNQSPADFIRIKFSFKEQANLPPFYLNFTVL